MVPTLLFQAQQVMFLPKSAESSWMVPTLLFQKGEDFCRIVGGFVKVPCGDDILAQLADGDCLEP